MTDMTEFDAALLKVLRERRNLRFHPGTGGWPVGHITSVSADGLTVGTHSGSFHADDLIGCVILRMASDVEELHIVRTRQPEVLALCDIILDVGGEYDPEKGRFDHHQHGGAGQRESGIRYSSAGLLWLRFGERVCGQHLGELGLVANAQVVAEHVDKHFMQAVDAVDNGQPLYSGGTPNFGDAHGLSMSGVLASLNPHWFRDPTRVEYDYAFARALEPAEAFLHAAILVAIGAALAEDRVREAVTNSPDPRVIMLKGFYPWKEIIGPMSPEALYVVFPAEDGGGWRIQGVPVAPASFELRKALPAAWRAKPQVELAELTGVADVVFVHGNGFIGGAKSLEGALRLAELALQAE